MPGAKAQYQANNVTISTADTSIFLPSAVELTPSQDDPHDKTASTAGKKSTAHVKASTTSWPAICSTIQVAAAIGKLFPSLLVYFVYLTWRLMHICTKYVCTCVIMKLAHSVQYHSCAYHIQCNSFLYWQVSAYSWYWLCVLYISWAIMTGWQWWGSFCNASAHAHSHCLMGKSMVMLLCPLYLQITTVVFCLTVQFIWGQECFKYLAGETGNTCCLV